MIEATWFAYSSDMLLVDVAAADCDAERFARSADQRGQTDGGETADEDRASEDLPRCRQLAEQEPRDDHREDDFRQADERRELRAEAARGMDPGDVRDGRRDECEPEHRQPQTDVVARELD